MLKKTITWRKLPDSRNEDAEASEYEVYDSDTGATIGVFASREAAENGGFARLFVDVHGLRVVFGREFDDLVTGDVFGAKLEGGPRLEILEVDQVCHEGNVRSVGRAGADSLWA